MNAPFNCNGCRALCCHISSTSRRTIDTGKDGIEYLSKLRKDIRSFFWKNGDCGADNTVCDVCMTAFTRYKNEEARALNMQDHGVFDNTRAFELACAYGVAAAIRTEQDKLPISKLYFIRKQVKG